MLSPVFLVPQLHATVQYVACVLLPRNKKTGSLEVQHTRHGNPELDRLLSSQGPQNKQKGTGLGQACIQTRVLGSAGSLVPTPGAVPVFGRAQTDSTTTKDVGISGTKDGKGTLKESDFSHTNGRRFGGLHH